MNFYSIMMLFAGVCVPVLAIFNASLGRELNSPAAACMVLCVVAFISSTVVLFVTGPSSLVKVLDCSKYLLLGGVFFSVYILSITFIAPKIGLGNAVFFILVGQIVSATIIDHFGLFGATPFTITAQRFGGASLMMFGLWLTQNANT